MNKGAQGILMVAAGLAAFYGVKTLKQEAMSREPTEAESKVEVAQTMAAINAQADREHPGMAKSDAVKAVVAE
ncbi:MAG: hypothetical protein ABIP16_03725, partial [Thermomonas sp.]